MYKTRKWFEWSEISCGSDECTKWAMWRRRCKSSSNPRVESPRNRKLTMTKWCYLHKSHGSWRARFGSLTITMRPKHRAPRALTQTAFWRKNGSGFWCWKIRIWSLTTRKEVWIHLLCHQNRGTGRGSLLDVARIDPKNLWWDAWIMQFYWPSRFEESWRFWRARHQKITTSMEQMMLP